MTPAAPAKATAASAVAVPAVEAPTAQALAAAAKAAEAPTTAAPTAAPVAEAQAAEKPVTANGSHKDLTAGGAPKPGDFHAASATGSHTLVLDGSPMRLAAVGAAAKPSDSCAGFIVAGSVRKLGGWVRSKAWWLTHGVLPQAARQQVVSFLGLREDGTPLPLWSVDKVLDAVPTMEFYAGQSTRMEDTDSFDSSSWDPLGMASPSFFDESAVCWTEPSSGLSLRASCLVDRCLALTAEYCGGEEDFEEALVEPLFAAIWYAHTLTWRHLAGEPQASDKELEVAESALRRAMSCFCGGRAGLAAAAGAKRAGR